MPNIRAGLVHLPGYKPPKGPGKAKKAADAFLGGAKNTRAGRSARNAWQNVTSRNALEGKTPANRNAMITSGLVGTGVGAVAGGTADFKGRKEINSNRKQLAVNQAHKVNLARSIREAKRGQVSKARIPRITSLGTNEARRAEAAAGPYPLLHKPMLAAGIVGGGALAVGANRKEAKRTGKLLVASNATVARQRKKLAELSKSARWSDAQRVEFQEGQRRMQRATTPGAMTFLGGMYASTYQTGRQMQHAEKYNSANRARDSKGMDDALRGISRHRVKGKLANTAAGVGLASMAGAGIATSKYNKRKFKQVSDKEKMSKRDGRKYTPLEQKHQREAAERGSVIGAAGGAAVGYKGYKGVKRVQEASRGAGDAYRGMRSMDTGRVGSVRSAVRTAPAAFKAPKKGVTLAALGSGYVGYMAGAVGGATAGARHERKKQDKVIKSAFGVEHEVEKGLKSTALDIKNEKNATHGRVAAGSFFPGFHGAIAGKKGKKLRAVGNEVGGSVVGSIVPGPGTFVGGALGTNRAARKGYYKPQGKGEL